MYEHNTRRRALHLPPRDLLVLRPRGMCMTHPVGTGAVMLQDCSGTAAAGASTTPPPAPGTIGTQLQHGTLSEAAAREAACEQHAMMR
jgi:hypothetical protein